MQCYVILLRLTEVNDERSVAFSPLVAYFRDIFLPSSGQNFNLCFCLRSTKLMALHQPQANTNRRQFVFKCNVNYLLDKDVKVEKYWCSLHISFHPTFSDTFLIGSVLQDTFLKVWLLSFCLVAVKTAGELSSWIKCRLTCHCLLLPTLCPTGSHHKDTRDAQRKENAATIKTEKPQMAG